MLKSIASSALVAAGLFAASSTFAQAADARGDWVRPNGASKIRISSCGGSLCGKLIWLREPRNDTQNPDAGKRSRPLVGVEIVQSMKPTSKTNQWKGKVYNAEDGKTYTGFIQLTSANKLKLEGCVMGGLICKGETWTRSK
ncbi:MAG: DUF2147 domain-containing protein [Roseibium sp.]|uniref:DUF2147 domain-containing protein n=1 Tax=Roseibium sp. TaxID=1936156 RepID=UPI001B0B115D|nr:DUF2147 domain-containing protein [Roseibium sp.]MBO6507943.1 DUF2147 domain-containing protein [Roseibium sp.]MBO6892293.1 DUF2147 domain-containing protein [Roseibium sp.]MBO6929882.1 DUF2147 domain-containing protein [Roseibium sp.]